MMRLISFLLFSTVVTVGVGEQFINRANASGLTMTMPEVVLLPVPFAMQVPFGEWHDPRQRDGCEETSVKMATMWLRGYSASTEEVRRDIINMSEYEKVIYGTFVDTSAWDTAGLLRTFYGYDRVAVLYNISTLDIKMQLAAGNLVIIPLNTQKLGIASYRNGPTRHTVVVTGYNNQTGTMLIHDPLRSNGANWPVTESVLSQALSDYNTGNHLPAGEHRTAMVVISK